MEGESSADEQEVNQQFKDQGIPIPIIKIDNKSDNFATVVSLEFGDQLGELLDTVSLSQLQESSPARFAVPIPPDSSILCILSILRVELYRFFLKGSYLANVSNLQLPTKPQQIRQAPLSSMVWADFVLMPQ